MKNLDDVWVATFAAKFAELHTREWASDIHDNWCKVASEAADDAVAALERQERWIRCNGSELVPNRKELP